MTWTNGKHAYIGSRNDRSKRMFSKLGMKRQDLSEIFNQIETETMKPLTWETAKNEGAMEALNKFDDILTEISLDVVGNSARTLNQVFDELEKLKQQYK